MIQYLMQIKGTCEQPISEVERDELRELRVTWKALREKMIDRQKNHAEYCHEDDDNNDGLTSTDGDDDEEDD